MNKWKKKDEIEGKYVIQCFLIDGYEDRDENIKIKYIMF